MPWVALGLAIWLAPAFALLIAIIDIIVDERRNK